MLFGLDGIEVALIIVLFSVFGGIMTGFPVAFALGGAAVISFGLIAILDSAGILIHHAIDTRSAEYAALVSQGIPRDAISVFRYPDLPRIAEPLFTGGWEMALNRNISFIVNRMNERVIAGQSIDTLLAVLMFVMMGITLERSRIANDLLTAMARVFGPLPGGLAVSIVVVGAFLAASTGIVGATVVTMGLLALPTMLRNGYSPELSTGVIASSGTLGQIIPPSIVIVLLGTLAGDIYSTAQENRAQLLGCSDALTYLGKPAVVSVGTLFQSALFPGSCWPGFMPPMPSASRCSTRPRRHPCDRMARAAVAADPDAAWRSGSSARRQPSCSQPSSPVPPASWAASRWSSAACTRTRKHPNCAPMSRRNAPRR